MGRILPILFNTDMVRAILDGRKTVTRRVVKSPPHPEMPDNHNYCQMPLWMRIGKDEYDFRTLHYMDVTKQNPFKQIKYFESLAPFDKGDILYVRETWREHSPGFDYLFIYKADYADRSVNVKWHPSIHMPKEAARIWLKITDVRVEKLNDISGKEILKEGINSHVHPDADYFDENQKEMFAELWDSTIKKKDISHYGWDANPWVWVIEFERCEKPEGN